MARKVRRDSLVQKALRGMMVGLGRQATMARQVRVGQQVEQEHQGSEDPWVPRAIKVRVVFVVLLGH
jgi:hypothetical protein